jgi:tetratricopeptide (TPR) repeat protein
MQGCRTDAIEPILQNAGSSISKRVYGESTTNTGQSLATVSYLIDTSVAGVPHQRNLFGFVGNAKTCAEIHISSFGEDPAVQDAMKAALANFQPALDYQPSAIDYFRVANVLFKNAPALAAPYYKSSLDAMPTDAQYLTPRRVVTDQLVMALGMSGDSKGSRAVAEEAIAADPDYPINYYNLACADAEAGNAADAKLHLQQAFDRRANVLKGEQMPDPTKDDSILKLKKNKDFWAFVVGLAQH